MCVFVCSALTEVFSPRKTAAGSPCRLPPHIQPGGTNAHSAVHRAYAALMFQAVRFKTAELYPDVISLFELLRSSGVVIAIVTDLTAQIQLRKLIYFDIDNYIDCLITSEEAGVDKSGLIPFELAIERLGIPPQEIWVVGDDEQADMYPAVIFQ